MSKLTSSKTKRRTRYLWFNWITATLLDYYQELAEKAKDAWYTDEFEEWWHEKYPTEASDRATIDDFIEFLEFMGGKI